MLRTIAKGKQSFVDVRSNNYFYIDKTRFIKDWWKCGDDVTLITRPRRFGKTLMLDTVKTFFSTECKQYSTLFEGLEIWQEEEFRNLQGSIPVIFLSFANIKGKNYENTIKQINSCLMRVYTDFRGMLDSLYECEVEQVESVRLTMDEPTAQEAILNLSKYIYRQNLAKPLILLDEYDAPLQEAWINVYWDELLDFMRIFYTSTFKNNPYMERALLTGITRISCESIFPDMSNLQVVGTTSNLYADCFGFTEKEVFAAMDEYGLPEKDEVKKWYDGFIFGKEKEIYNPWSIINYLSKKRIALYWAQTSSNALVGTLILQANNKVKKEFADLLLGKSISIEMEEDIIFSQLYKKKGFIWSLLMASGYLKPLEFNVKTAEYKLTITNYEVRVIMERLVSNWFTNDFVDTDSFRNALLKNDLEVMNKSMNQISQNTFSFFDTGGDEAERFYHAFVLGLIVDMKERYEIKSNRESGDGRYDIMMIPKREEDHGIVIEFKTMDSKKERKLEIACCAALKQIKEKRYTAELEERGIAAYVYGFAFSGKHVLIYGGAEDALDWERILG